MIHDVSPAQIDELRERVLNFYAERGRDFPWRRTTDPWLILISEVMLQQTQAARVVPFFEAWKVKFDAPEKLAEATNAELLEAWRGLGFWRRAVSLRSCAGVLVERFGGRVPRTDGELQSLPGIGPYTAAAIRAFAWDEPAGVLDTNIRRILVSEFHLPEETPDRDLRRLAEVVCPPDRARDFWNAMMDYGALEATARRTGVRPRSQQTKFHGSRRQARSRVLKLLLERGSASLEEIRGRAGDWDAEEILADLESSGLAARTGDRASLA